MLEEKVEKILCINVLNYNLPWDLDGPKDVSGLGQNQFIPKLPSDPRGQKLLRQLLVVVGGGGGGSVVWCGVVWCGVVWCPPQIAAMVSSTGLTSQPAVQC